MAKHGNNKREEQTVTKDKKGRRAENKERDKMEERKEAIREGRKKVKEGWRGKESRETCVELKQGNSISVSPRWRSTALRW